MAETMIKLRASASFIKKIDKMAKTNYVSRSAYIREAIAQRINREQLNYAPPPITAATKQEQEDEELLKRYNII